ncbi:MAG TPA: DUF1674 domain-containing protein [Nevskia sp.]|jgi:hypothetical protein|nr:DUF1674 domain-containing protein [Nevskia sp.]
MTPHSPEEAAAPAPGSPGAETAQPAEEQASAQSAPAAAPRELGGRKDGTEPTRYGDWEKHGRCIDF